MPSTLENLWLFGIKSQALILKKNISLINIKVIIIFTKEEFYPKIIHNQINTKFKIIGGEAVGIGHNNTLVEDLNNVTQKKEITSTCLHI